MATTHSPDEAAQAPPRPGVVRPRRLDLAVGLLLVGLVVGLGLLAAAVRPAWNVRYQTGAALPDRATDAPTWQPTGMPSGTVEPAGPVPTSGTFPVVALWVVLGVLIAGVIAVLVARWWSGRPTRSTVVELTTVDALTEPELPVLQRGADEASRRLLAETDPTDAIIAAWLALEEAAASSGVRREPAQTPTEFTAAVLTGTGVDPEPVHTLLGLYHRARFARTGSRPDDLETARRCIGRLADAWRDYRIDVARGDGAAGGRSDRIG